MASSLIARCSCATLTLFAAYLIHHQPMVARAAGAPPELSADIVTKAKQLKTAQQEYVEAKCDEHPKAQQNGAKAARDKLRDELNTLLATAVSQSAEVQGALNAATEAGENAGKLADSNASQEDKASAVAKFQIAKTYLRDVAKAQRDKLDAQMKTDTGIMLASLDDGCPEEKKSAKATHKRRRQAHSARGEGAASPAGAAVGGGGGGVSIGVGGGSFSFGH